MSYNFIDILMFHQIKIQEFDILDVDSPRQCNVSLTALHNLNNFIVYMIIICFFA